MGIQLKPDQFPVKTGKTRIQLKPEITGFQLKPEKPDFQLKPEKLTLDE